MEALRTYGDWVSLIDCADCCNKEMYDTLINGSFEENASARIFVLVQAYCTRCINKLTSSLSNSLKQVEHDDIDSAITATIRFSTSCKRLFFFKNLQGFPREGKQFEHELKEHITTVFRDLRSDYERSGAMSGEEMAYQMTKLLREWKNE